MSGGKAIQFARYASEHVRHDETRARDEAVQAFYRRVESDRRAKRWRHVAMFLGAALIGAVLLVSR